MFCIFQGFRPASYHPDVNGKTDLSDFIFTQDPSLVSPKTGGNEASQGSQDNPIDSRELRVIGRNTQLTAQELQDSKRPVVRLRRDRIDESSTDPPTETGQRVGERQLIMNVRRQSREMEAPGFNPGELKNL